MGKAVRAGEELQIIPFAEPADWEAWLDDNHTLTSGVWLRMAKKSSGHRSITYAEALEVALCYGWIDGQKRGYDETWWLQKFTPRRARSIWSKVNREKCEELIRAGRMKPAGLKEIESARGDGRWDAAYDSQSSATVPDDLQRALDENAKAAAFFAALDSANRYAIIFRIQTAVKAETRARRIAEFIGMLERHEKVHA